MSQNELSKQDALSKLSEINRVEGFDPTPLTFEIGDMGEGGIRRRLPVMTQMAWFRLKYPEGRIAVSVKPGKDPAGNTYFIAEARVYAHYNNPVESYLAEGSASRGYIADKPTVSPREWAQTAAIGMALRNAGFGLQFAVAGESFEDNTLNELTGINVSETVGSFADLSPSMGSMVTDPNPSRQEPLPQPPVQSQPPVSSPAAQPDPETTPLEKAQATPCPISRFKGKTLGELAMLDPNALVYVSKNGDKYGPEVAESARLICENALQSA